MAQPSAACVRRSGEAAYAIRKIPVCKGNALLKIREKSEDFPTRSQLDHGLSNQDKGAQKTMRPAKHLYNKALQWIDGPGVCEAEHRAAPPLMTGWPRTLLREHGVVGLEIAVDDILLMGGHQCGSELLSQGETSFALFRLGASSAAPPAPRRSSTPSPGTGSRPPADHTHGPGPHSGAR